MDTPELPLGYFDEGRRYLDAVELLGLKPSACFWAYDTVTTTFVLVLITEEFEAVGPLELSKSLFKAYNAGMTPGAINPFMIRLHSPHHQIVRELETLNFGQRPSVFKPGKEKPNSKALRALTMVGGLDIDGDWIYRFDRPLSPVKSVEIMRRWRRFERNIEKAAA